MNIEVERQDSLVRIAINRPLVRNALNTETIHDLIQAFRQWGHDPAVRAIILTGTGDKAFCAGADLEEVRQLSGVEAVRRYFGGVAELIQTMAAIPPLVIAAVFGYTLAGGMGLAAGADLLVAASDTQFGLPEIKIGLFPMVVMAPIVRLIGKRRALELLMSGRMVDAATMEQWGFCNRVVASDQVQEQAMELARTVTAGSSTIARMGKEAFRESEDLSYEQALHYLQNMVSLVALTEDSREGVAAFAERRPPNWTHR